MAGVVRLGGGGNCVGQAVLPGVEVGHGADVHHAGARSDAGGGPVGALQAGRPVGGAHRWGGKGAEGVPADHAAPHRAADGGVYAARLRGAGAAGGGGGAAAVGGGHSCGDHRAAAGAPGERLRRPGGGGGAHRNLRSRLPGGADGGGDAGLHRDHVLHHRGVFWRGQGGQDPVCRPGGAVRGYRRVPGGVLGGAAVVLTAVWGRADEDIRPYGTDRWRP